MPFIVMRNIAKLKFVLTINICLQILHRLTPVDEDRESLQQVVGLLQPLQMELKQTVGSLPKKYVLFI
mgnify:CR=1 FL=1